MSILSVHAKSILFTLISTLFINHSFATNKEEATKVVGNKDFVHLEQKDGIWTLVNADGEAFIPLGMNHVGPMHRFAPYNKDHWVEEFGDDIMRNGRVNFKSEAVKKWMERIAKDHKDYGFNTLAFHHPHILPTEYFSELKLYYIGKLRMSHVHAKRAKRMSPNKSFPDVFDPAWIQKLDGFVKRYTTKHKNSTHLIGYSYDDLPAYTINNLEKRLRGFEHHPWIMDILSHPGKTNGKSAWIEVLKAQYSSAEAAGKMYGLTITKWDDFYEVTTYGMPQDVQKGFADQALMNAKIVEAYHKAHHDAIRKHDPNHLILGDKIQNARMQPDWVWNVVKKYVDVVLIQDYDFFTPAHEKKLKRIYEITNKPIINGDHAYGALRPNMKKVKGVKVSTMEVKGQQYAVYLKGIMNLPFMLGWQVCGYMETWEGTSDPTGKSQTGFFDPMGNPIEEALKYVKVANEQALNWHKNAGKQVDIYSSLRRN